MGADEKPSRWLQVPEQERVEEDADEERRRQALSPQKAVVSPRSEADYPRVSPPETLSPRTERVSPREDDAEEHVPWFVLERLGGRPGGCWIGDAPLRWG